MHSSYALTSDAFTVERGGDTLTLAQVWPGGYQKGDRLGVLLATPMDGVGCSNLICGTNTLFYDELRTARGQGNFFRYADTYLFGVGCEPGDYNQLDVWPPHKVVSILQPTAETVLEAINDRHITLLLVPEGGVRCRGGVVLSTWNAYLASVRAVLTYAPRSGRARQADTTLIGNRVVESYVEQAIFSTPGIGAGEQARLRRLRRVLDREPMHSAEEYRTLSGPAAGRALLGVSEVLPPGHQEPRRRGGPTVIMPVEAPPVEPEAPAVPDFLPEVVEDIAGGDALLHTPLDAIQRRAGGTFAEWEGWDWISDFGDPVTEHHTVREAVGIWDESPLRKWEFRGPDAKRAVDYCFTNDMLALQVGQCRYGCFTDENGKMLGDGVVFYGGDHDGGTVAVTALDNDLHHFRQITAGRFDVEIVDVSAEWPHVQVQGPRSRELLESITDADVASLRWFRYLPEPITIGGVAGCILARTGYSGELGYEVYVPADRAEALWQALLDHGGHLGIRPYGLAAVESLRIESGLIFIGFDYFVGSTSPFHVNLDNVLKLDGEDFHGRDALRAERDAGITHRMATLVIAGEEAPDYDTPVTLHGRTVGKLTSPSAGRSPSVDQLIGLACLEIELTQPGTRVDVTLADGRTAPAIVAAYPIYDPEKSRPRS